MDSKSSSISHLFSNCFEIFFTKIFIAIQLIFVLIIFAESGPRGKRGPPGLNGSNGKIRHCFEIQIICYHYLIVFILLMTVCLSFRNTWDPGLETPELNPIKYEN